jgi:hypothetical protein
VRERTKIKEGKNFVSLFARNDQNLKHLAKAEGFYLLSLFEAQCLANCFIGN